MHGLIINFDVQVIVERYAKEGELPLLDKTKFLVPQELTMSQFVTIIRWVMRTVDSENSSIHALSGRVSS